MLADSNPGDKPGSCVDEAGDECSGEEGEAAAFSAAEFPAARGEYGVWAKAATAVLRVPRGEFGGWRSTAAWAASSNIDTAAAKYKGKEN